MHWCGMSCHAAVLKVCCSEPHLEVLMTESHFVPCNLARHTGFPDSFIQRFALEGLFSVSFMHSPDPVGCASILADAIGK